MRRLLVIAVTVWLVVGRRAEAVPAPGPAAGPGVGGQQDSFQYTRSIWRVSDGLPEDTVQAIAESAQGLLWVGTTGGLARFDGSRIQLFEPEHKQLSSANSIFCLTLSRDGSLWAGTEGGGLLRIRGTDVKNYASAEGLSDGFVRSVFEDDRGRLWVGTDGGLFYKDGGRFRRWDEGANAQPVAVHSITEDREHRLWIGGSRLFSIDAAGHEQVYVLPGIYSQNRVKRILQTPDGTVWVGTVGGLQRLRDGHFEVVPGITSTVRTLLETEDGTLWIGTIGDGLWTLRPEAPLVRVSKPGLLPSDTVLSIFQDDQRQVWVGTQAGLVRLNRTPVKLVSLPEGGDPDFETISGDLHGDVWVAAQRLYLIRDGVARPATYGTIAGVTVRNIFRGRDGALWIGTDGSGVYRVRSDGTTVHFAAPQLTNNFIRGFLETRDGTIWIACDEGVSLISAHGVRRLSEADGLAYFSTRSLLEDRAGGIWIGTDRGLSHWVGGRFRQDEATRLLASEKVWSILEDRAGALWFGTRDHGLFRYRDGKVTRFTKAEGLLSNSIYQILQDRRGTFWVTGPNTIASIGERGFDAPLGAPGAPLSVTAYTMPFGADGAQMYGGRQPAGYLAPDDSVWFPTNRGAAHIDHVESASGPGPRVSLDEVTGDGRTLARPGGTLEVASRVNRVSFNFSAVFLRPQEGLRFQYRLENFDKGWNLAGSARDATYTNLPAGRYRFRVMAFDAANPSDPSEVDAVIVKLPYFYQTWWFYLVCILMLSTIAWSLYQVRLRQMRTQFAAVLEERGRLAREMHDTVIQGCTGISALLEAVAITPAEDAPTRDELLEYARRQARSTVREARQVVWNMRHEQESDVNLIAALRNLVEQTSRESSATVTLQADMEELELKASIAHELLMTVREAITNALQHSGSRVVDLAARKAEEGLAITITDHGTGFDVEVRPAEDEGHYGILGMRERAERIGSTFTLKSESGVGTWIQLLTPLSNLRSGHSRS